MRESSLTAGIRELAITAPLHRPADTADVDDLGGIPGRALAGLGQEGKEGHAQKILSRDVGVEGVHPLLLLGAQEVRRDGLGGRHVRLAVGGEFRVVVAGDAGVVDEDCSSLISRTLLHG